MLGIFKKTKKKNLGISRDNSGFEELGVGISNKRELEYEIESDSTAYKCFFE
jgi:hypothetical protein